MARKFLDYTGVSYLWQKIVAELNKKANNQDLATVATSGSYNDLINKPAIPTKVSDLQDDSGHYIKPVGGIPAQDLAETYLTQHQDISGKANSADLATVATSGSYNDLLNKPFIPSAVSDLTDDSGHYIKPVGGIPAADLAETYLTTETDPTVPSWAKATQKPTYTAAEVGAPTVAEMNTAIGNAIGNINSFDMAVVQELPSQNISTHTIYLVPKTGETNDVYDEYVYINSNWEMVGNTQIDLSNYVQKTDYATKDSAGVVKYHENLGIAVTASGLIAINPASSENVKSGGSGSKPIVPAHQHESTFYGLAKAAGDTTQSQSDNVVGTYTTEAKAAIQQMLDIPSMSDMSSKVDKSAIENAGITNKSYSLISNGEFSFTTVDNGEYGNNLDVTTQSFGIGPGRYRVTFDNQEYELESHRFVIPNTWTELYCSVLGNLTYSPNFDENTVIEYNYNVPFFIFDTNQQVIIYTETAGEHHIKIEAQSNNVVKLPHELIHTRDLELLYSRRNGPFNNISIGQNGIPATSKGVVAIGFVNKTSGQNSVAIGVKNIASDGGAAIGGWGNTASGNYSFCTGLMNTASGNTSNAFGSGSIASAQRSTAIGWKVTASKANQTVLGKANVTDTTVTHAMIIGNGTADNARSNAYAIEWNGTAHYAGDVYVGANADSTGGTRLATVTEVAAKLDATEAGLKVVRLI